MNGGVHEPLLDLGVEVADESVHRLGFGREEVDGLELGQRLTIDRHILHNCTRPCLETKPRANDSSPPHSAKKKKEKNQRTRDALLHHIKEATGSREDFHALLVDEEHAPVVVVSVFANAPEHLIEKPYVPMLGENKHFTRCSRYKCTAAHPTKERTMLDLAQNAHFAWMDV